MSFYTAIILGKEVTNSERGVGEVHRVSSPQGDEGGGVAQRDMMSVADVAR